MITAGVLIFSFVSPAAKAAIGNCHITNQHKFVPVEITTPVAFDAIPNGSLVAKRVYDQKTYSCSDIMGNIVVGFKLDVIPGIKLVNQQHNVFNHYNLTYGFHPEFINIYTVPELESRGLGFVTSYSSVRAYVSVHCSSGLPKNILVLADITLPLTEPSIIWSDATLTSHCNGINPVSLNAVVYSDLYIVKIGNSSQHATLPQNFTATLFGYSLYTQFAPTTPAVTFRNIWSITSFAANVKVRTCTTPTASESTIYFGHYQQGDIQSKTAGTVLAQRDFTFTFVCPRKRYDSISFLVEPKYGIEPVYPGTMKNAPGDGMAKGIGVQLFVQTPITNHDWTISSFNPVVYRTDPLSNAGGYMAAAGKYPLFQSFAGEGLNYGDQTYSLKNDDPPTIQRVVKFKANLIRLPGAVQPGQIKAAALIHIRYN